MRVWGHSDHGWTPIMFHLRGLFMDEHPAHFDRQIFCRADSEMDDPIFSMMYLNGSVRNGTLIGKWTPPGPSPTNSVLLWPETLQYFSGEAAKLTASAPSCERAPRLNTADTRERVQNSAFVVRPTTIGPHHRRRCTPATRPCSIRPIRWR